MIAIKRNPGPMTVLKGARELREMFVKNKQLPKVQKDIKTIFGEK